jgi:Rieske Fe-S protein
MIRFLIILIMLLLGVSVQTAMADCVIEPYSSSGKTNVEGLTDGSTCKMRFSSNRYQFTESDIVKKPKHGTLDQINVYSFDYTPYKNFKGIDDYDLRVCTQLGCSLFSYKITIH